VLQRSVLTASAAPGTLGCQPVYCCHNPAVG